MKNGKKLTYEQKQIVMAHGLNVEEWFYVKRVDATHIQIVHKTEGITKILDINYRKGK